MFRIQTNSRQDFSVSGYQHFNSGRPRDAGLVKAVRVLGDVAASAMGRLLDAMYTSRRRQVIAAIECSAQMIRLDAWGGKRRSSKSRVPLDEAAHGMRIPVRSPVPRVKAIGRICATNGAARGKVASLPSRTRTSPKQFEPVNLILELPPRRRMATPIECGSRSSEIRSILVIEECQNERQPLLKLSPRIGLGLVSAHVREKG